MTIKATIERITPESARRLLDNMIVNRPIKNVRVQLFMTAMKDGVFNSMNGETLIVNDVNQLEDGQHRLTAFIESGLPHMDFFVVRGVGVGAGQTVDQGTSRGPGDVAEMVGYQSGKALMAAARWLWIYENAWPNGLVTRSTAVPTQTLLKFLEQHRELPATMAEVRKEYAAVMRLTTGSAAIFVRYVTERLNSDHSTQFFDSLKSGDTQEFTRQTRFLRDKLLARSSRSGRLTPPEIIVITTKVWNAMREGRDLTKLYISKSADTKDAFALAPRFK